jgi:hypothetical protein
MAIFKYTVANKDGKKLSGSIEAVDEAKARGELNNLGFSILAIEESKDQEIHTTKQAKFAFEATNPQGQNITGTIPAQDELAAYKRLSEEYELMVSALWQQGLAEDKIQNARIRGTRHLQEALADDADKATQLQAEKSQEQEKKLLFVKTKVEKVIKQVTDLLQEYSNFIQPDQKKEIEKKLDKLLRIKGSSNTDYIEQTTEELIAFIRTQEKALKEKGYMDKRTQFKIKIKSMLNNLHKTDKPASLSEDIVENIRRWQQKHVKKTAKTPWHIQKINAFLSWFKDTFETPEEIKILRSRISTYNSQIWEYAKMYFKEPAPEYKEKVKNAIRTIWATRKKTVKLLKETRARLKKEKTTGKAEKEADPSHKGFLSSLESDLSEFTGWLVGFYLIYYFISLYITSKDFGLGDPSTFPKSFQFYDTQIFKYALIVVFLVHISLSLKVNFFEKNKFAGFFIFPITIISITFTLINF